MRPCSSFPIAFPAFLALLWAAAASAQRYGPELKIDSPSARMTLSRSWASSTSSQSTSAKRRARELVRQGLVGSFSISPEPPRRMTRSTSP